MAGAVQRYHRDLPPVNPRMRGSPGSSEACALAESMTVERPAMIWALAKLSFGAIAPISSSTSPAPPFLPATMIW